MTMRKSAVALSSRVLFQLQLRKLPLIDFRRIMTRRTGRTWRTGGWLTPRSRWAASGPASLTAHLPPDWWPTMWATGEVAPGPWGRIWSDTLHLRPPTPKQAGEVQAYNAMYGFGHEGYGSLSDSTESLPLPPTFPCHSGHRQVSRTNSGPENLTF